MKIDCPKVDFDDGSSWMDQDQKKWKFKAHILINLNLVRWKNFEIGRLNNVTFGQDRNWLWRGISRESSIRYTVHHVSFSTPGQLKILVFMRRSQRRALGCLPFWISIDEYFLKRILPSFPVNHQIRSFLKDKITFISDKEQHISCITVNWLTALKNWKWFYRWIYRKGFFFSDKLLQSIVTISLYRFQFSSISKFSHSRLCIKYY